MKNSDVFDSDLPYISEQLTAALQVRAGTIFAGKQNLRKMSRI